MESSRKEKTTKRRLDKPKEQVAKFLSVFLVSVYKDPCNSTSLHSPRLPRTLQCSSPSPLLRTTYSVWHPEFGHPRTIGPMTGPRSVTIVAQETPFRLPFRFVRDPRRTLWEHPGPGSWIHSNPVSLGGVHGEGSRGNTVRVLVTLWVFYLRTEHVSTWTQRIKGKDSRDLGPPGLNLGLRRLYYWYTDTHWMNRRYSESKK